VQRQRRSSRIELALLALLSGLQPAPSGEEVALRRRTVGQQSHADEPLIRVAVESEETLDEVAHDLVAEIERKMEEHRRAGEFGDFPDFDNPDPPRALTSRERATLEFLLTADLPGIEALRMQAQTARANGYCGCGCPSIGLEVDRASAPQSRFGTRMALEAHPRDPKGTFWLALWTDDGWLSSLDLDWVSLEPPCVFPPRKSLQQFERPFEGGTQSLGST
jgi:hypothetical protein